jgi:PAS domain S-box-containing protein
MFDDTVQDQTEKIAKLEKELANCRQELATAKLDHGRCEAVSTRMLDSYYRVDLQGNVQWTSPSAAAMLGYDTVEEVIGLNLARDFYADPTQREGFLAQLTRDDKVRDYKVVLKKRDGSLIVVSTNSYFTRNENGEITGVEGICRDITEQERYRRALEDSEKKLTAIFNAVRDGILVADTTDHEFLAANRAICEMLGYTLQEITKLSVDDIHPAPDLPRVLEHFEKQCRGEIAMAPALPVKRKAGTVFYADVNSAPAEIDGTACVIGVFRDITERMEAELALNKEKENVRQYLDIAGVMLAALNARGEITLINKKGCEILAVSEEEALGKNWFEHYLPPRVVDEVKGVFDAIMAGNIEPFQYMENPVLTSHGEEKIIAFHNTLIHDSDGKIAGGLFSGEDVTLRRRAEEEKAMLENRLRQAYKMEAIGTMAGGIAHDFNNILAVIIGNADLALGGIPEGHVARHNIDQVLEASNRAKDLVRQILVFSRKENLKLIPIRPHLMVEETLKLLRSTTPATVSITINVEKDCGMIMADPTQFHQLLMNLFANAVQAMDEKGEIRVGLQEVTLDDKELRNIAVMVSGRYVRLTVADSGFGMDKKTMERAFDPFYTTKGVGKGTGMGLAVVHGIVKSHGAVITVDSEPGKGTTFQVYFPVSTKTAVRKFERSEALPKGTERILFVDDEEMIASLARRQLESQGYHVTTATDPVVALEMFRADPEKFDLVVTDQSMPVMSGVELVGEFLRVRPAIPIILCTGYSTKISAESAPQFGVKGFCQKPCDRKLLVETVRRVLDDNKE